MINIKPLLASVLFTFTVLGGSLITGLSTPKVEAAAAICYSTGVGGGNFARVVSCNASGDIYDRQARQQLGHPIRSDFCYEVGGLTILEYRLGSADCNRLATAASQTASQPAKCFVIQNNKPVSAYDSLRLTRPQIAEAPCSNGAIAGLIDPEPGMCYIFNKAKTEYRSDPCLSMLSKLVLGQNNSDIAARRATANGFEIQNTDRAKNLNCGNQQKCLENNSLVELFTVAIKFFTVIIGVLVTAIIIWAGFTYAHAGGDPSATSEAKNRIKNAIIALACFIFMGVFLNWAVPGGLF